MTTTTDAAARGERFAALHRSGCFLLPNAWDAGSARLLASLGPAALATTSAGAAWTLGKQDSAMDRAEALANARAILVETDLPVSADFEDGFGPAPEACAATVRAAIEAGLAGCTIEDTTRDAAAPIHGFDAAVARVRAAVAAVREKGRPFVLTARAENFLHGRPDLEDTIRRLVAFAEAGADCLYAPALPDLEAIRRVVAAVAPKPVNVLIGPRAGLVPMADLAAAGVRRVSLGGALARAAYGQALDLTRALLGGDLPRMAAVMPHAAVNGAMRPPG
ncbi:isocitrate lyase/PEP mutase family protein [Paracraurococcus lichenis]|uniref:Isocitrate lyase/phosphoenolpyruvate mutase family protein n=1 Tax=Paracraurococcus lichenis TaxID=3064888 RepID=A0ABT9E1Y5_9PROT|nr:isocitrate lyase/phosphoenolpyruvate mutase family protein [Paracraurococcus sp. LOR1-02]MDO9710173.1 isocitrate lyase/phosphoenolpyruvate mutase family protein [Paracraurococcus sp. LOR1-02]